MCGINGIFSFADAAPAPRADELITTRDHMRRRGPDGAGEWWSPDRRIGLGHRRLAIIDLDDRAAQPMTIADGRLALVFNGEIYNYRALRDALERDGAVFRTQSDTEVILQLYAREGAAMLPRLRGMFAFALFDAHRGGVLLARDPYGIKPLYYTGEGGTLRFASQVKALVAGGGVSRALDPAGRAGFELFGHVPDPFTLYRSISAVPAGTSVWCGKAGPQEAKPFASIPGVLAAGRGQPVGDLAEITRTAVLDSVRHHLVADVEVGAFLSAGIDSGALLGLMRDAGQDRIRTITLAFDDFTGTSRDEAPLAAEVAAVYGAAHTTRMIGREEMQADLPALFDAMDQPSIDGVNVWLVAKAARELGLKVALSGLGGDELFAGYPTFHDVPRWRRRFGPFARIPGAAVLVDAIVHTFAPGLARRNPKSLGLLRYAGDWSGAYLLRRAVLLPFELDTVMEAEAAREGLERLAPLAHLAKSMVPDPGSDNGRVTALESAAYMRNQLLRDADWAGMAHSMEIRTPLVDYTLLQALAPCLPGLTPGAGKRALAMAPTTPLPIAVIERPKSGFSVPMASWMSNGAQTKPDRLDSRRWARRVMQETLART